MGEVASAPLRPRPSFVWALPGAAQLSRGRWASGAAALTAWVGAIAILVTRSDRVIAFGRHGPDEWVAVAVLLACLVIPSWWSVRDARRSRDSSNERRGGVVGAFASDRWAMVGLAAVMAAYAVVLLAPLVTPHDPIAQGDLMTQRLATPSASHPLGTDQVGRDVLSRLLYGGRASLLIATLAVALSISVGTVLGAVSGYVGGVVDAVTMRFVDVVISFPRLVLLVTLVAFFERTWLLLVLVLGLTQWPPIARIVRGEVLSLRERDFVVAARGLGFSTRRIVLRHLLPNVVAPVVVAATLGVGETIVLEAGLSFLGLGAGVTSWGAMIADGRSAFLGAWWLSTFPGLAIVLTVLAFNLVGDGLRNATSPRAGPAGGRG